MDDNKVPDGVVVASNGAWKDKETGRFVKGMPAPDNAITKDNSADYFRMRQQKQVDGMLQADRRLYDLSAEYWGDLAEAMYNVGLDGKGVAQVQAVKMVGDMTGFLSSGNSGQDPVPPGGARLELGAGSLETIAEYLREYRSTTDQE